MGNTESNVTSGVKKQAGASTQAIYKLVDLKGGGLLVELMKRAAKTKQYAELDHAIKTKVEPFLYNKGKGRLIPISQLVLLRNKERPRHKLLPQLRAMEDPNDFDINKVPVDKDIDPSKCRDVCWDLNERGAVGETILHLCLLNATALHADLAKRLLRFYPKLINDIYMSDEYYGENVLHLAIVNEDPAMVKYLLNCGADFQERCCGNFMTPEDQKSSRTDSVEHEWVCLSPDTNYDGYVYWGEYPLSFCACLGQEECYRLILARGANPDAQDTNGNTALHMLVIYEKINMFDTAYEIGASLGVRNVLNLTPLTLAAKLARIEMFFHILNIEREIYWQIGSITCAAYPLSQIDTIDIETGRINKNSALNLVVFGDKDEHLELMDGVLVDLLNAKWNAFVKSRFYQKFFLFLLYFLVSLVCFTNRPGPAIPEPKPTAVSKTDTPTTILLTNNFPQATTTSLPIASHNLTSFVNHSAVFESVKGLLREFDDKISNSSNISIKHVPFSTLNEKNASGIIPHQFYEHRLEKVAEDLEVDSIWSIKNISMIRRKRNAIIKIAVQRNIRKKHKHDGLEKNGKNNSEEMIHNTSTEHKYDINMKSEYDQSDSKSNIENMIPLKFLNDVVSVKERKNGNHLPSVNAHLLAKNEESFDTSENMTVLQETLTKLYGQTSVNENIQINNEGDFEIFLQLVPAKENATVEEMLNYITHAANKSSLVVFGKGENYTIDEPVLSKEMFGEINSMTSTVQVEDDDFTTTESSFSPNSTLKVKKDLKEDDDDDDDWWGADEIGECRLLKVNSLKSKVRLVAEATMEVGAVYYILEALREAHFLGLSMFIENLMTAPSRVMFLFSCFLMLIMPLLRFFCVDEGEDMMSVIIMLTTAPYFLFFCRGFKTVGPFVVMIYRMVMGDLLRFVSIYLVFVMGFSQAYYIIFLSYDNPKTPEGVDDSSSNPMQSPMESVMAMFLMSLTNFGDYYGAFERTEHQFEAKFLFVVYMGIVAILLVNMLIAMMGNTYQKIAETRNEWQRQWARIVLVVERGVSPAERLRKLMAYSQPMADGRRALVLRLNQSEEDKEEMKRILEMKRVHDRIVKRRKRGAKLLGSPSGTATASAMPSPCPTKRLPGESTLLQPTSVINHSYNQVNPQNMIERY